MTPPDYPFFQRQGDEHILNLCRYCGYELPSSRLCEKLEMWDLYPASRYHVLAPTPHGDEQDYWLVCPKPECRTMWKLGLRGEYGQS